MPTRDVSIGPDGMKLTLGDTIIATPSHPFVVGAPAVQRYFTVMAECATASKLRAGAK